MSVSDAAMSKRPSRSQPKLTDFSCNYQSVTTSRFQKSWNITSATLSIPVEAARAPANVDEHINGDLLTVWPVTLTVGFKCFELNVLLSTSSVRLHGINSDDLSVAAVHYHIRSTSILLLDVPHMRLSRTPFSESGCIRPRTE